MFKKVVLYFILSLGIFARAQNLVPNGDFEIYSICPDNISQISYATGWINAESRTSPDYYNACASVSSQLNVPYTVFGYQKDCCGGYGYAGIYVFNKDFPNDGKEYIQTKLLDTLKAGHKYLTSMRVNNCNNYNYGISSIGMYFTSTAIQGPSTVGFMNVPNPQVQNTTFLNDTVNWMLIQDTVIGTGSELYLTIGNFSYDSLSDTMRVYSILGQDYAYYYIDNVSVVDVATLGVNNVENGKTEISVYPNPTNNYLKINCGLGQYVIGMEDVLGNIIKTLALKNKEETIDVSDLPEGIYFVNLKTSEGVFTKKIIIQH